MSKLGFVTIADYEVCLRLITKEDAALLVDLFYRLSSRTKWLRFHWRDHKFTEEEVWQHATRFADLDWQQEAAVIATVIEADGREHAIGVARLARQNVSDTEAEAAIVVRDDFQKLGLGKHLLRALAQQAKQMGITHAIGWVMPENVYLMKLVTRLGFKVESITKYGERMVRVEIK